MTQTASQWLRLTSVLTLALAATASGCKSSGTSRWAWNPWSKASADVTAVADTTAPKLPTADTKPQLEGLTKPTSTKTAPSTATLAQGATPPAVSGMAPAIEAFAAAVPSAGKPVADPGDSAPAWKPYPTSPGATAAATTPPKTPPAATVAASAGPYDPNGYQPATTATPSEPTTDRYGLGNRYASASANAANPFADLPPIQDAATAIGDRYAAATEQTKQTAAQTGQSFAAKTEPAAGAIGDRYGATVAQATSTYNEAAQSVAKSVPAPPATPSTAYPSTASVAATPGVPSYPVATTTPSKPTNASSSVGTLPPSTSVYASTATPDATPITPIEPASANETPTEKSNSVIRLTTLPGEYRPGGTSTYRSSGAVAPTSRY